jgi:hypothetical protein
MNLATHRSTTLLLTCLLAIGVAFPARAQDVDLSTPAGSPDAAPAENSGPTFVIHPVDGGDGDYFTLEAAAGSTTELTVVLGNADDESIDLRTYASDAVPTTNGGFAIADEGVATTGTGSWLDYPAETFTFEPGLGVERTFTVTVPDDAQAGQYIAGLALQTPDPIAVEGSSLFNQIIRKTIAVFITVPGPERPAYSLDTPVLDTTGRTTLLTIPVVNSGNVLVKPHGTLTLSDASGTTVLEAPIAMGSVYAGTTEPLSVGLTTDLPDGDYELAIHLTDEATGTSANLKNGSISIVAADEATSDFTLAGTVMLLPDVAAPVYADVAATIVNSGQHVVNAQFLLDVSKDGTLLETFPLASALTLPQGETVMTQRYIPPTGWEAGSWSFVLRLDVVDGMTGTSTNVATLTTIPAVSVGG